MFDIGFHSAVAERLNLASTRKANVKVTSLETYNMIAFSCNQRNTKSYVHPTVETRAVIGLELIVDVHSSSL